MSNSGSILNKKKKCVTHLFIVYVPEDIKEKMPKP